MSTNPKVALIGASGNLGPAILKELLAANLDVTILTRQGSSSTASLPSHPNQTIREADYESQSSLEAALKGIDVVISNVGPSGILGQKLIIDAAIQAGVTRFFPSEFGVDLSQPKVRELPIFGHKIEVQKYLAEKVKSTSSFSYTLLVTGAFLDWGLAADFFVKIKSHQATLYDGGNTPFSATRLSTIGAAVVAIITKHLEESANETVRVSETTVSQNGLIAAVKKADGREWTTDSANTADVLQQTNANLGRVIKEGKTPGWNDLFGYLLVAIYDPSYHSDFSSQGWNKKLGLPELDQAELEKLVIAHIPK